MALRLGYNTNGFEHHGLDETIDVLAEIGYRAVALTLDRDKLDPFGEDFAAEARRIRARVDHHEMTCVVETGARFLLDPARKHEPTLVSADAAGRARRIDFLKRAVDLATELSAEAVSFWAGRKPDAMSADEAERHLVGGCQELADHALVRGVNLAFEPEPGMVVETMAQFDRLREAVDSPMFFLTLDVGHVHCLGDGDPAARIAAYQRLLMNVHIEDMRRGAHEHLMFGEGEMQFEPIIDALAGARYTGGVHVELSRHSADAERAARQAFRFLTPLIDKANACRKTL